MDSNLDNLQTMLTSHGFSVDTSTLLDVSPSPARPAPSPPRLQGSLTTTPSLQLFSPSVTVPDMNLPDLDSSLASVRRRGGWGGRGRGGASGELSPCSLLLPWQIQELLSPQEPPRPLEAEKSSPDSGELSPPPPPSTPAPLAP